MSRNLLAWFVFALIALAMPRALFAQSAIAGAVKDASGAVLPGVTVEASSPVLIEKMRSVVTDGSGQYKIVDLRPGTYAVKFTLPGFSTVIRDGIIIEANFTASINVDMKVGGVEETITVSGQSPLVDVQTTQKREVVTKDVMDLLPTGRNFQTAANILPSVVRGAKDVGGSTAMQTGTIITAYGSLSGDSIPEIDGMNVGGLIGAGNCTCIYDNEAQTQEVVVSVSGTNAEYQSGGVHLNRIPKQGGNEFRGQGVALFANTSMQGSNLNDDLIKRGLAVPAKLSKLYDVNYSLGGPILKDRLWFFASGRNWAFNNFVANALNPDGSQAVDDNRLEAYPVRLTAQLNQSNKITALYDKAPKYRGHRELEMGGVSPEATVEQTLPLGYLGQVKWTSVATSKLLIEAGFTDLYYGFKLAYRPEVRRATCFGPFAACASGTDYGDITHLDITKGTRTRAATQDFQNPFVSYVTIGSVSYVTGSHALKFGFSDRWGWYRANRVVNGDLLQRYRNGVPDSVEIKNTPVNSQSNLKADFGLYGQDSWTREQLTLNFGVRYDYFNGEIPEQEAGAGRFVGPRHFDKISHVPLWKDVSTRLGGSYDLFGDGRTALKASIGRYVQADAVSFQETYNPMVFSSDTRTWSDLNKDDIAQENEIGPPTNNTFGIRRNRNADPNLKRPYQYLYNVGLQRELRPGWGLAVSYNRRGFYRRTWTENLAVPLANINTDYTKVLIPDPRGNGETLTVYNLVPSKSGLINEFDSNSTNNTMGYNGFDFTINGRFGAGGTVTAGTSTGKLWEKTCDVSDPNTLRGCDKSKVPYRTSFKMVGTYPLPKGIRASAVFLSEPGEEITVNYIVNRTVIPTLTQSQVTLKLNEPGTVWYDLNNQLDLAISKVFQVGRTKIRPQLDLFNALNVAPVVSQNVTFGSSLGTPLRVLDPRLARISLWIDF